MTRRCRHKGYTDHTGSASYFWCAWYSFAPRWWLGDAGFKVTLETVAHFSDSLTGRTALVFQRTGNFAARFTLCGRGDFLCKRFCYLYFCTSSVLLQPFTFTFTCVIWVT